MFSAAKAPLGLLNHLDRGELMKLAGQGVLLSIALNLIGLVTPVFFTQIYDRVLTTGSFPTLIALTLIAILAIALGAVFEQVRNVAFMRASAGFYADLEPRVYRASHIRSLAGAQGRRGAAFDDLESVRSFIAGPMPGAFMDLLFAPLFLAILFVFNFWIGLFGLFAIALMGAVAALTQWAIGDSMRKSMEAHLSAANLAEGQLRGAEAAAAMGFVDRSRDRWADATRSSIAKQVEAAARAGGLNATARGVRQAAQILMIAIAAALAVMNAVSAGAIIASSIILSRLLGPVDQLLGGWRQLSQARLAAQRLHQLLDSAPPSGDLLLARPNGQLTMENLFARAPDNSMILRGLSFRLEPGEVLGVIGPTGAGKSTLLRCALGVWPAMAGAVRLDGISLQDANRDVIGAWLGFLPQNVDLIPGTIAENIRRFGEPDAEKMQAAIEAAGLADIIKMLPAGLDTSVGEAGASLSAGQRRRVALARALYGDPSFVCLDEPEAHLDREGELALGRALARLKATGATVIIAAHRPNAMAHVDKIMILNEGRIAKFGPAAEIMQSVVNPQAIAQQAIKQATP